MIFHIVHLLLATAFLVDLLALDFLADLLAAVFCGVAEAEPEAWAGAAAGAALLATLLVPAFLVVLLAILLVAPPFLVDFFETLLVAAVLAINKEVSKHDCKSINEKWTPLCSTAYRKTTHEFTKHINALSDIHHYQLITKQIP